jgi:hypothetical protein
MLRLPVQEVKSATTSYQQRGGSRFSLTLLSVSPCAVFSADAKIRSRKAEVKVEFTKQLTRPSEPQP